MEDLKYLTEAFQDLNILNEDTFDINADGLAELTSFYNDNDIADLETVIDPVAQTEEELQDSYIGKAILDCVICQSKIYKDPEEVIISEDGSLANVGEICPYCQSSDGYKVIGQVAEYCPHCDDEDVKETVVVPKQTQTNTLISKPKVSKPVVDEPEDEVLNRLEEINKAKIINPLDSKPKAEPKKNVSQNLEENPNAFDEQDEFYDLESKKLARDTELVTMLVFDEIGPIVGVDEKIYGPFRPQDLVTLPLINAKVFFKNRKGRQVKI